MSKSKHLLLGPELIQGDGGSEGKGPLCMEYTVHAVPNTYRDEVKAVFPNADLDALKAVITCQKSQVDLVKQGEQVENEKNELLERFTFWSRDLCAKLEAKGYWSDFVDPCSGLAMVHQDSQSVYDEVASLAVLRGFKVSNAGCCKVVLHPKWGSFIYPASFFTTAPESEIKKAIDG